MDEFCDKCSWDEEDEVRYKAVVTVTVANKDGIVLEQAALCKECYTDGMPTAQQRREIKLKKWVQDLE